MTSVGGSAVRDGADGLRMAVGTLSVLPVRVTRVDRPVAGWAMALAPVAGALLGLAAAALLAVVVAVGASPSLAAALAVGLLALLTRGLHLDGLADLADGLGSGRPAAGALEVMRRSDIGPFGVVTLVLVLLVQVLALGELAATSVWAGAAATLTAVVAGRLAITWACTPRVPSARPDGLGATVAGAVPLWAAGASTAGALLLTLTALPAGLPVALACGLGLLAGVGTAVALLTHAVRRLGGITGDVLGAISETATSTALVITALAT